MIKKYLYLVAFVVILAFIVGFSTTALAADFYKGKTIRFIVGFSPGGGYDTYTRAIARYIAKYIPGNPTPIVQNMTGGGSLIAANYTYNRAKPDGLTIGVWSSGITLQDALNARGVKIKSDRFGWIGAPVKGLPACAIMGFTGLKTLEDVLNSKKPIKIGATRAGSTTDDLPKILNKTLGTNFEVVSGYRGTATIRLAMQKKEVDGACWGYESMRVTARSMLDAKGDQKLIPFVIHGKSNDPEVKDLPQLIKVVKGKDNRAVLQAWLTSYEFMRPLAFPPKTPTDRLQTLRTAFKKTMHDPAFLADTKKSNLLTDYVSGEDIDGYVSTILATPANAKEKLGFLVRKKKKK